MRLRASKRSSPAYGPAAAVMRASSPITLMNGRLWRLPASKSLGSCAGVTFTTPVPNFGIDHRVGDDRNLAVHERQNDGFAVQMLIARVVGMHSDRGVAEHGFGPRGGDGQDSSLCRLTR